MSLPCHYHVIVVITMLLLSLPCYRCYYHVIAAITMSSSDVDVSAPASSMLDYNSICAITIHQYNPYLYHVYHHVQCCIKCGPSIDFRVVCKL